DAGGAADGGERQRGVVGGGVLDRAAGEGERAGGRVVEVGGVLAGSDRVGEGEGGAAAAACVAGAAARVERERRRAGDADGLAEGDRDSDRLARTVGAVGRRRGHVGHRRRGGVDDDRLLAAKAGGAADGGEGAGGVVGGGVFDGAAGEGE